MSKVEQLTTCLNDLKAHLKREGAKQIEQGAYPKGYREDPCPIAPLRGYMVSPYVHPPPSKSE